MSQPPDRAALEPGSSWTLKPLLKLGFASPGLSGAKGGWVLWFTAGRNPPALR
jgi:hypothetical protein